MSKDHLGKGGLPREFMQPEKPVGPQFTRSQWKVIIELGEHLEKSIEDFLINKAAENVIVNPEQLVKAMNYVVVKHDNRVNEIGDNWLQAVNIVRQQKIEVPKPFEKESQQ